MLFRFVAAKIYVTNQNTVESESYVSKCSASVGGGSNGAAAPLDFEKVEIAPINF